MRHKKYRLPPPARSDAPPAPAEIVEVCSQRAAHAGSPAPAPWPISPLRSRTRASSVADGVNIIEFIPAPRRWLRVALVLAPDTDTGSVALAAAWFVTRLHAIDKRLRLTMDCQRCAATADELVLEFSSQRGGSLAAEWLEEVKPAVRELAAGFAGAEVKSVEVVSESGDEREV